MGITNNTVQLNQLANKCYQFKPTRKKLTHPLENNPRFTAHAVEIESPLDKRKALLDHEKWFPFGDQFIDPQKGVYFVEWTDDDIKKLNIGLALSALDYLRTAKLTEATVVETLEWICSEQFAQCLALIDINANAIRCALPQILNRYGRETSPVVQRYLAAFAKLDEHSNSGLNPAEQFAALSQLMK